MSARQWRRRIAVASLLAVIATIGLALIVVAQDDGTIEEPTVGLLATATGVSLVIAVFLNVLRGVFPSQDAFSKWAPTIAVVIGIGAALLYAFANGDTSGPALIQAVLVGLFGGYMSQNANTQITRAIH